ncbi:MAG: GxGYxYP domain-containing protein [Armatimonadota bacterium]
MKRYFCIWVGILSTLWSVTMAQQPLPDWETIHQRIPASFSLPQARYAPVRAWEAEGNEAGSHIGIVVNDPTASGGRAREVRTSQRKTSDDLRTEILFGPYIELPPGTYVALFRVKLLDDSRDGEAVGEMDACVGYGQQILSAREFVDTDLKPNQWVELPLLFRYDGGKLECRLRWTGYASLSVDRVSLFRAEGLQVSVGIPRVPPPQLSGKPDNLRYAPAPALEAIFLKSQPPANTLLVLDIRGLSADWQLLLFSLQGIVNRQQPQIYYLFNSTDDHWLDWMLKRGFVKRTEKVETPDVLLQRFRSSVKGVVVYDPTLPATRNVATMLAGVQDALVASPRLARQLHLPIIEDLRGRWKKSVDAYRWALDTLWDKMNHHLVACSYPDHLALRDYLVQHKVFIFWVSGPIDGARPYSDPNAEMRLAEEILSRMPPNTAVLSYPWAGKDVGMGEGPGVTLFAEFGKYLVGTINCSNLSVHSGIRIDRFQQKPAPQAPPLQESKVYVSFIISDGDNLPVLTISNFPQFWADPTRGTFPIGWTISPAARLLLPAVVDYYYQTSTPHDSWMTAVSGIGYTYPDHYGKRFRPEDRLRVYDDFLRQTQAGMVPMDLHMAWIMGISDPDLIARYAQQVSSVQALFPDYGRRVTRYEDATYLTERNVPVFHAVLAWPEGLSREERLANLVRQVKLMTPPQRPAFLHLFVLNWFADLPLLKELLQRLGEEYVAVRPEHLAQLYLQAMEREQVLIRAPERVATVGGQPVRFAIHLRNTTKSTLRVSLQTNLQQAVVTPAEVTLSAGASTTVQIAGNPSAEVVQVSARGSFGQRTVQIPVLRVEMKDVVGNLPSLPNAQPVALFEAEVLSHLSGEQIEDPSASGGRAWRAVPGSAQPGHIVFGPYAGMSAGRYLVLFRLKRLGEAQGNLLKIDTCVGGGTPVTAERVVKAEELPIGQYRYIPLITEHPGGAIETRVEWFGKAGVAVDCIALWRLQ